MADFAGRGKTSTGWFYGFKLHLMINDQGELLNVCFTPGNVDDRKPVPKLSQELFGKLVGDKDTSAKVCSSSCLAAACNLITRIKSNMKNRLILLWDKLLLRKRAIVETVIDQLKNISQIEHSRHRGRDQLLHRYCRRTDCIYLSRKTAVAEPAQRGFHDLERDRNLMRYPELTSITTRTIRTGSGNQNSKASMRLWPRRCNTQSRSCSSARGLVPAALWNSYWQN